MGNLKAALTAIFNTNTYTSSTSNIASKKIPVTESNGLPSGQIGMSDLASVLGVQCFITSTLSPSDLNDVRGDTKGLSIYNVNNNPSNLPSGESGASYILEVINSSGVENAYDIIQTLTPRNSTRVFKRCRIRSSNTWTDWVRIDNFGCATATDLASLLGDARTNISSGADLNDFKTVGVYMSASGTITLSLSHKPSSVAQAFRLHVLPLPSAASNYVEQIICELSNGNIFRRICVGNSGWNAWYKVTMTEVS